MLVAEMAVARARSWNGVSLGGIDCRQREDTEAMLNVFMVGKFCRAEVDAGVRGEVAAEW